MATHSVRLPFCCNGSTQLASYRPALVCFSRGLALQTVELCTSVDISWIRLDTVLLAQCWACCYSVAGLDGELARRNQAQRRTLRTHPSETFHWVRVYFYLKCTKVLQANVLTSCCSESFVGPFEHSLVQCSYGTVQQEGPSLAGQRGELRRASFQQSQQKGP